MTVFCPFDSIRSASHIAPYSTTFSASATNGDSSAGAVVGDAPTIEGFAVDALAAARPEVVLATAKTSAAAPTQGKSLGGFWAIALLAGVCSLMPWGVLLALAEPMLALTGALLALALASRFTTDGLGAVARRALC